MSHSCDGRSHFLSGPWAHVCDENKGFTQTPVTFLSYALSCWELYHSKEYTVPFPMTYDTVVGGIENFCEISIWSHVTQMCSERVARCGSSATCASMELARCGSSATCASHGAKIFPVCLAFQGRKISSILSSCSFWRKNHTNQREVWFSKNILAVETFPQIACTCAYFGVEKTDTHYMWMAQNNAVPEACDCAKKWVSIGLNEEKNPTLPQRVHLKFVNFKFSLIYENKSRCFFIPTLLHLALLPIKR